MKNSREMERLGALVHASCAGGWATAIAGCAFALGGHLLGKRYNDARGNRFESTFHRAALGVATAAIAFGIFAVGVDSIAAVSHARDARLDDSEERLRGDL